MAIWVWKVLDNRLVEASLGPLLALGGLIVAAVLLPEGSGLEGGAEFFAFWTTVILVCKFFAALVRRR